jgi:hypothetical protein
MDQTYRIIRFYFNHSKRVIAKHLTLKQAQDHCHDPEASSSICVLARNKNRTKRMGNWFDGYDKE